MTKFSISLTLIANAHGRASRDASARAVGLVFRPFNTVAEVRAVSIVRIGLAETKKFSEGYDAIFGKKQRAPKPKKVAKKPAAAKAKASAKKKRKQ